MSETVKQPDKIDTDPISELRAVRDRVAFLEKQMAAVMRHLDSNLPPGVARAWPQPDEKSTAATG